MILAPAVWALLLTPLGQPSVIARDPGQVRWTLGRIRLAAGSEWDTNARRAIEENGVEGTAATFPNLGVTGDGLFRAVVDSAAGLRFGQNHALRGFYVLGAKRFFRETTEDLLVQELGLASEHRAARWLTFSLDGTYKGSRIRNGLRDYDVLTAGVGTTVWLASNWQLDLQGRLTRFIFDPEPQFDYWGPRGTIGLRYRPRRGFAFSVQAGAVSRFYDGRALVEAQFIDPETGEPTGGVILTFCEDPAAERESGFECTPAGLRRDLEVTAAVSVSYRGPFLISSQYLLRLQRSNSDFENIDRHRIELTATFVLPWRVTVNVLGALQLNQGVSITDQRFLADADENQNSVAIGLKRPMTDILYVEGRYSLFANQFSTADVTFFRHTVYVGVGYRTDLVGLSR